VRDYSWDDFLSTWYSAPLPPTVGEWCHYIPPALVLGADLEPLDLSVAGVGNTTVHLTWSATAEEDATGYWLYVKSSYDIGWVAQKIMPLSQTSLELPDLLPGADYRFMIVAQDAEGVALAKSNEAVWKTFSGRVYLPVVR
jgi:fibronectin type III domain protein